MGDFKTPGRGLPESPWIRPGSALEATAQVLRQGQGGIPYGGAPGPFREHMETRAKSVGSLVRPTANPCKRALQTQRNTSSGARQSWVQIPGLLLTSWGTRDR